MIGGFYGFTAVTLGLSRLNVVNFVSMLKALDTPTNRIQLVHLKKDFEELFKSLDSVSKGYSTGEGRRSYIKLSRKLYNTEEEKARNCFQKIQEENLAKQLFLTGFHNTDNPT